MSFGLTRHKGGKVAIGTVPSPKKACTNFAIRPSPVLFFF